jgi:hypothetical protein
VDRFSLPLHAVESPAKDLRRSLTVRFRVAWSSLRPVNCTKTRRVPTGPLGAVLGGNGSKTRHTLKDFSTFLCHR